MGAPCACGDRLLSTGLGRGLEAALGACTRCRRAVGPRWCVPGPCPARGSPPGPRSLAAPPPPAAGGAQLRARRAEGMAQGRQQRREAPRLLPAQSHSERRRRRPRRLHGRGLQGLGLLHCRMVPGVMAGNTGSCIAGCCAGAAPLPAAERRRLEGNESRLVLCPIADHFPGRSLVAANRCRMMTI